MGLGIRIGYRETIRIMQAIKCPGCGRKEGHDPLCPKWGIDQLRPRQKWLHCPICMALAVDKNRADLWECRECHKQFQTETSGDVQMVFPIEGHSIIYDSDMAYRVSVLTEKGQGEFAIDEAIARFQQQIGARKKPRRKKE